MRPCLSGGDLIVHLSVSNQLSRRQFLQLGAGSIAMLTALAGCESVPTPSLESTPTALPSVTAIPVSTAIPAITIASSPTTTTVNFDAKIAQMIMVGFRGLELRDDNPIVSDIRARQIGGVFLFDYDVALDSPVRNIHSPQQLKSLDQSLQKMAVTPLLIGIDQEGGKVSRLKEKYGFPPSTSAQALGTLNNLVQTRAQADSTAQTLVQAGINLNLAPVVDLNTNPDNPIIGKIERSFAADPTIVTNHALEVIKAHHAHGVLTTLKHFPGHGSSTSDSHLGFVDVTATWSRTELEPYANIIRAGQADVVMSAHVFNGKLDAALPATLSKNILTGILRGEFKYDGVMMSDDMQMQAITKYYGLETAIESAINAGIDILSFANNLVYEPDIAARAIAIIKSLVRSGKIGAERIEQSYQRIMRLKQRLG